jgi:hypothetical protein
VPVGGIAVVVSSGGGVIVLVPVTDNDGDTSVSDSVIRGVAVQFAVQRRT